MVVAADESVSSAAPIANADIIKSLTAYVKKSCPGVLGGDAKTLEAALSSRETEEILKIFANDIQISCLIVQRCVLITPAFTAATTITTTILQRTSRIPSHRVAYQLSRTRSKLKRKLAPGEDPLLVLDNEYYVFELQMKPLGESNGITSSSHLYFISPSYLFPFLSSFPSLPFPSSS
jgi:hypothetical protein